MKITHSRAVVSAPDHQLHRNVIFLAVIVWAVTRIFPGSSPRPDQAGAPGGGESAGSMLDRRLAAGEIDEDTYLRLQGELTHTR